MLLGCFLGQVACVLWRLLADSAQVPFSTAGQIDQQNRSNTQDNTPANFPQYLFANKTD